MEKIIVNDTTVILQSDVDTYYIFASGEIIKSNVKLKTYIDTADNCDYNIFGKQDILILDNHTFYRVDELILYLFQGKLLSEGTSILHLDGDTLNDSSNNLQLIDSSITKSDEWHIDTTNVEKDLSLLLQSESLKSKYEELVAELKKNPYRVSRKFLPRYGLRYNNTKFDGLDVYHAVISEGQRLFYVVRKGTVVITNIERKGIVEILQAYGHDYRR